MNERVNIYRNERTLIDERARMARSGLSNADREVLQRYQDHLLAKDVGAYRVARLSMGLRTLRKVMKTDFSAATKEDIEALAAWINLNPDLAAATKSDFKQIIKQFFKFLKGTDEFPPEVKWMSVAIKMKDRKHFDELIHRDEVNSVIYCCENIRDKAFVSFLYETGARIAEVLNMRIKDFKMGERAAKVRLCGKTGERWVVVVSSAAFVAKYIEKHPFKPDLDAYLWLSEGSCHHQEPLLYIGAVKILKRAFRQAGVKKRCNPHLFRHSRATELAKDLTEVQMSLYLGWVLGTKQVRTYVHASGREVDDAILRLNGVATDQEKADAAPPIACYRCGLSNRGTKFCTQCGFALSTVSALQLEHDTRDETNKTMQLLMELSRSPELMREYEQFRRKFITASTGGTQ